MFAAVVSKPLAIAFALFFCLVIVLPSPVDANAGAAASVDITSVVAITIATSPRVVWFICISLHTTVTSSIRSRYTRPYRTGEIASNGGGHNVGDTASQGGDGP